MLHNKDKYGRITKYEEELMMEDEVEQPCISNMSAAELDSLMLQASQKYEDEVEQPCTSNMSEAELESLMLQAS